MNPVLPSFLIFIGVEYKSFPCVLDVVWTNHLIVKNEHVNTYGSQTKCLLQFLSMNAGYNSPVCLKAQYEIMNIVGESGLIKHDMTFWEDVDTSMA